jgi:hypothetical protein
MFTTDPITGLSYFRPGSLQPLYMFELFGLLVALAAYNGIAIPVSFPLAFYKQLLDIPCLELRDIQDGWPDIVRSLQSIKDGAYEGLEYVLPLEANGLRMSVNRSAFHRLCGQYSSGNRIPFDLSVEEMSRIESGASAASTNPYYPSDHQWPGWNIHAPRSGSQFSVDDGSSTPGSTASQIESVNSAPGAQAEQPHVVGMLATLAGSDPKLKNLMKEVAANTATEDQLKAFSNHVNRARALAQAEKRKEAAAAEESNSTRSTSPKPPADATTNESSQEREQEQDPSTDFDYVDFDGPLTAETVPSYISAYASWLTTLSILPQLQAFKKGFHTLLAVHENTLLPFTPQTLSLTLQGSPTLDLAALRRATQYKNYEADEPYIKSFWRVVGRWEEEKQKALVKFVTAAERVPAVGAGGLVFRVQRSGGGDGGIGGEGWNGGMEGGGRSGAQAGFEEEGVFVRGSGGAGGVAGDGEQGGIVDGAGEGEGEGEGRSGGGGWGTETELLPTSSTCFGTLYLPRYKDEETLQRKLGIALEFGGVGFGTA